MLIDFYFFFDFILTTAVFGLCVIFGVLIDVITFYPSLVKSMLLLLITNSYMHHYFLITYRISFFFFISCTHLILLLICLLINHHILALWNAELAVLPLTIRSEPCAATRSRDKARLICWWLKTLNKRWSYLVNSLNTIMEDGTCLVQVQEIVISLESV